MKKYIQIRGGGYLLLIIGIFSLALTASYAYLTSNNNASLDYSLGLSNILNINYSLTPGNDLSMFINSSTLTSGNNKNITSNSTISLTNSSDYNNISCGYDIYYEADKVYHNASGNSLIELGLKADYTNSSFSSVTSSLFSEISLDNISRTKIGSGLIKAATAETITQYIKYTLTFYNLSGVTQTEQSFNGKIVYESTGCQSVYYYNYTGDVQSFTAPGNGYYSIELWGAQGASSTSLGGYTSGQIYLEQNEILYLYVGKGLNYTANSTSFNAGTGDNGGYPGGGATDVRLLNGSWNNNLSLNSRIMVAGGSGSGSGNNNQILGAGGGLYSKAGGGTQGGNQTTYGAVQSSSYAISKFGVGNGGCAGGNGYYPGGGATCVNGAGGGSSYISGYAGVNSIVESSISEPRQHTNNTIHYSGKYFIDGKMQTGVNAGNGKAVIKYYGMYIPERKNTNLNNVRYIKDCTNGESVNGANYNQWLEIEAIKNGVNIALGKNISGVSSTLVNGSSAVDGKIDGFSSPNYAYINVSGTQCVIVDLGAAYNLDEVAVWHYWLDNRMYNANVTYVSNDSSTWKTIISTNEASSSEGKRISAYR